MKSCCRFINFAILALLVQGELRAVEPAAKEIRAGMKKATRFMGGYRRPLLKALDFIVQAQYPNGAWPQRFPLSDEFAHDGLPDYTPFCTLNDGAARGNIELLVDAAERLGEERYLEAAKRAVDFLISVQGPEGQAAWAEQYGNDLKPAAARTHEPAGYVVRLGGAHAVSDRCAPGGRTAGWH